MNKTAPKLYLYMACDIRKGCRFLGHSFMAVSGQYFIRNLTIHKWNFQKHEKVPHVSSEIFNQNLTSAKQE